MPSSTQSERFCHHQELVHNPGFPVILVINLRANGDRRRLRVLHITGMVSEFLGQRCDG